MIMMIRIIVTEVFDHYDNDGKDDSLRRSGTIMIKTVWNSIWTSGTIMIIVVSMVVFVGLGPLC